MLQPGIAKAKVLRHWFTTSQGGTPGLSVRVEVSDDWDAGQEMVGTIWLSPKAMGMARSQLKALGFDCTAHELDELDGTDILVGNEVDLELKEEEYKGRRELKIARFGGPAPKPTKDALKAATAALRAAKKEKPEPPQQTTKPPFPDVNAQPTPTAGDDQFPWEEDDAATQKPTP
jgi:hypothetical protein